MDTLISPRRRSIIQAFSAASFLVACGRPNTSNTPRTAPFIEFGGWAMGSFYSVKLVARSLSQSLQSAAKAAVTEALATVDFAMSSHRPQSELSRFNAHTSDKPFALSADTFSVFALANKISHATAGAFDITVAPIVDAWGFGAQRDQGIVNEAESTVLKRQIGWRYLQLNERVGTIIKSQPEIRADLSGIAKGYGVDKAAYALDALGVEHYLIDLGGEVRTRGHNPEGLPWQVAIEQPLAGPRQPRYIVPLSGQSIATSGDYRIYFERDGKRYSHEINPSTGHPIDNHLASVSVVASTGAQADALGKLIVLGAEKGYNLAVAQGLAAHFIIRESDGIFRDTMTPAFAALGGRPFQG